MRCTCFVFSVALVLMLMMADASEAQLFGGNYGGPVGGGPNYYNTANCLPDPRLGYCLENDCFGGGCSNPQNRPAVNNPVPRSRFVVVRGGRRVLTYVGTFEGFQKRYPRYANRVERANVTGDRAGRPAEEIGPPVLRSPVRQPALPPVETPSTPKQPEPADGESPESAEPMPPPVDGQSSPSDESDG